jgi:hypothetical protein
MDRREKQEAAPVSLPLQPSGLSGHLLPVTPRVRSAPELHLSLSGPYLPYFVAARRERCTVRQPAPRWQSGWIGAITWLSLIPFIVALWAKARDRSSAPCRRKRQLSDSPALNGPEALARPLAAPGRLAGPGSARAKSGRDSLCPLWEGSW